MSDPVAALVRYVAQQAKAAGFCPLCNGQQTDGRTVAHTRACPVVVAPQHVEGLARALVRAGDEFDSLWMATQNYWHLAEPGSDLDWWCRGCETQIEREDPKHQPDCSLMLAEKHLIDILESTKDRPKNSKPPVE